MKEYFKKKLIKRYENRVHDLGIDKLIDEITDEAIDYVVQRLVIEESVGFSHHYMEKLEALEEKIDRLVESGNQSRCQLSNNAQNSTIQFIAGQGSSERNKAVNHLKDKLVGTNTLIICDPYFIKGIKGQDPKVVACEFASLLPNTLKQLELYVKPRIREKEFAESLNAELKSRKIKLVVRKTDDVHDRVWIKDFNEAFVVGTSFNGLGNKCAFILDLPPEDRKQFMASVNELTRLPKSKSA
ncbi:TPA: hypothetical protein JG855_004625 [Vibrio parahaemolyticus]|uniref:hypothetical protein n=8 Tax=Vibrio parahaemolyticus TaxID=670 RepID=UPI00111E6527|nr:hypothetical protein [Vibrio parahaemolyticus]EGQ9921444.1 hypothetical protein [Vibrio parahaemolyticus]MDF4359244.1 hypothetical protein [Vibrio parahaemolyticus]MDF4545674.1 hypothetical protein [Vibrio parahaemolyticus]MDG2580490.1 hypothetical protein [Vibrio parahaemolyticus]MDG2799768.1 hypothetical protein [Vibrio parahaemolyticus]